MPASHLAGQKGCIFLLNKSYRVVSLTESYIGQSQRELKNTWERGPEARNVTIPNPRTWSKSSQTPISEGQPLQTCGKPFLSQHKLKALTQAGGLVEISADLTLWGRPWGRVTSQMSLSAQCVTEALVYAPFQGLGLGAEGTGHLS